MYRILLLTMGLTFFTAFASKAQLNIEEKTLSDHSFGLSAGLSTGVGLSYRYWPSKLGIQTTVGGLIDLAYDDAQYNVGLTFLYELRTYENERFFFYQGNNFYNNWGEIIPVNGAGLGLESMINEHIGVNGMAGLALYYGEVLSMTAEAGIYFRL